MTGLRLAISMFTVVPAGAIDAVDRRTAAGALRWLPIIGVGLGAAVAVPLILLSDHAVLLGAVLSVVALALLTRGLHLDGLADLMDGLGSRRPAAQALEIMRRPDIGAFGMAALVLVVVVDVFGLATVASYADRWTTLVVVALAASTGRLAAVWAGRSPAARPDGFGALVAGSVSLRAAVGLTVLLAAATAALGAVLGNLGWLLGAGAAGLAIAAVVQRHAVRRLGGTTGDVFGGLVEIATSTTLVVAAIGLSWG